jgi:uncharacterized membrane protein (DUF2068 family)
MARSRRRPNNSYELVTCAWRGHALVGTDAAQVTPDDAMLVRQGEGVRWYRCLRCDAWLPGQAPQQPARDGLPPRSEIEIPTRGPLLRDKYVLRLIACERAIHVVVFSLLAIVLFLFARHDASLHRDYVDIMSDLNGGTPAESQVRGVLGYLGRAFKYSPHRLVELGLIVTLLAAVEATEMVGLWFGKRWAEYLTFIVTTLFVPVEIYELTEGVSIIKIITLVINVAIVVYLLVAKRLFGVRGGYRVEAERRREFGSWAAVERATPPGPTATP